MPSDSHLSLPPKPLEEEMRMNSGVIMAREIELYLFKKFLDGLNPKVALYKDFQKLKKPLEDGLNSSSCDEKSIRDNLYYLNNVLTECRTLSKKQILTKYRIKSSLEKIQEELEHKLGTSRSNDTTQDSNGGSSTKSGEVSGPIPLPADHGIGKTTLCQLFFSNPERTREFLPGIWVSLSRLPHEDSQKKAEIVKRTLFQLGVEDEVDDLETNLSALVALLYKHLWGKKYLIVLDSVCSADDEWYSNLGSSLSNMVHWGDRLAHGLPKGYGGVVIVTCRNEEMARKMVREDNLHQIMPLSDPKICRAIFENSTKQQGKQIDSTKVLELQEDIKNKCAGLPLAAKIMGQIYEPTTSTAPANTNP
ncbi:hypothetical protein NL676_013007 [Syzygium grande]|nr:hypothetical protein NL676_013007 [Syzygium grande]